MTIQIILAAILRHLLTTLGGGVMAIGGDDMATTAAGALVTLGGVVWSVFEKRKK